MDGMGTVWKLFPSSWGFPHFGHLSNIFQSQFLPETKRSRTFTECPISMWPGNPFKLWDSWRYTGSRKRTNDNGTTTMNEDVPLKMVIFQPAMLVFRKWYSFRSTLRNYESLVTAMGETFFQTAQYGWRSVAAWFLGRGLFERVSGGERPRTFGKLRVYTPQTNMVGWKITIFNRRLVVVPFVVLVFGWVPSPNATLPSPGYNPSYPFIFGHL